MDRPGHHPAGTPTRPGADLLPLLQVGRRPPGAARGETGRLPLLLSGGSTARAWRPPVLLASPTTDAGAIPRFALGAGPADSGRLPTALRYAGLGCFHE